MKILKTLRNVQIRIDRKQLLLVLTLSIILPNIIIDLAQLYFGYHRSYINLDYLFPFLLIYSGRKFPRIVGSMLLMALSAMDFSMILLEYFPTLNLKDALYLLGFIFSADKILIVLFCAIALYLIISALACYRFSKKTNPVELYFVIAFFFVLHPMIHLAEPVDTTIIKNRITESRLAYLIQNKDRNFLNILKADVLSKTSWSSATQPWWDAMGQGEPLNDKLLLIVAESWGQPNDSAVQQGILEKIKVIVSKSIDINTFINTLPFHHNI
jgi:hypothetical protein